MFDVGIAERLQLVVVTRLIVEGEVKELRGGGNARIATWKFKEVVLESDSKPATKRTSEDEA